MVAEKEREPAIGELSFYFDAFRELSSCRQIAMGLGPIPFTAIVEYSRLYQVGDFEDFLYFIRLMDNELIMLENKRAEKSREKNKTKKGR